MAAGDSTHADASAALSQLCQLYWYPLYVFVRRKGFNSEDAQDLTQGFFEDFLARDQVSRADPARGRFRSFLVGSLENFLHNQWRRRSAEKRGGGRIPLSLDAERAEARFAAEPLDTRAPDVAYAVQWARTLLEHATQALAAEWVGNRREGLFPELLAHLWSDPDAIPYPELAARFGLTPVNLRVTFHRYRQRYRELLRDAVAATVADPGEVEDELRFLMEIVSR